MIMWASIARQTRYLNEIFFEGFNAKICSESVIVPLHLMSAIMDFFRLFFFHRQNVVQPHKNSSESRMVDLMHILLLLHRI